MLFLNTNKKYTVNQSEIEKKYYLRNSRKITSFEQPTGRFFTLEKDNRYIECPYITTKSSRHERMILRLKNINAKKRLSVYRGGDRTVLINANYVFPAHAGVILSRCFCNGFFLFLFFHGRFHADSGVLEQMEDAFSYTSFRVPKKGHKSCHNYI